MKKKWMAVCLTVCLSLGTTMAWGADKIALKVNGQVVNTFGADAFVDGQGRTQVPLRALAEKLNYGVIWDADTSSALLFTISQNGAKAQCFRYVVGSTSVEKMTLSGQGFSSKDDMDGLLNKMTEATDPEKVLTMDTAPQIVNERTFIPVRYVAELFNNTVTWDEESHTVLITTK